MKSFRFLNLAIASVVLAALAGVLYWSNHRENKKPNPAAAETGPVVFKVDPASATALTIKTKGAPAVSLARDANGWRITAPKPLPADQEQVSMLLSSLAPLTAEEVVEQKAANLTQYGLDAPSIEVDVTGKGHREERLLIGDDTPVGSSTYAMLADSPRVYTIASYAKSALNKTANDLRNKRLITMNADQMSRIELTHDGATIVLAHTGAGWTLEKPQPYRTDAMAADGLASALADAQMETTQPPDKELETAYANGKPVATARVTGPSGTQSLDVRAMNNIDYVKSSVLAGVYEVDESLGDSLAKSVDDFRNKQVFDFGDAEPDAIEMQIAGAKASLVDLVKNPQGWWRNGKKMDADEVENLVSALRDLTATKFATSGFTTPAITATVTSNNGKRVEKVEIAKIANARSGDEYLARRSNDPSLYVLDGGAVEGLESAATSIKPAAKAK